MIGCNTLSNTLFFLQEVLPGIVATLGRPLRPVAPHLHTPAERASLGALVATLLVYALKFAAACNPAAAAAAMVAARGGAPAEAAEDVNALAPPVHRLTMFPARASSSNTITPNLVSREGTKKSL